MKLDDESIDEQIKAHLARWCEDLASEVEPYSLRVRPPVVRRARVLIYAAGAALTILLLVVVVSKRREAGEVLSSESSAGAVQTPGATSMVPGSLAPPAGTEVTGSTGVTDATATTANSDAPAQAVPVQPLSPGAWDSARSSADGLQLLVQFIGAPEFKPGDPCTADYTATIAESEDQVALTIDGSRPAGLLECSAAGVRRSLLIGLANPIGDRRLLALGRVRPVFDGAQLAEVGWLPDGWGLRFESAVAAPNDNLPMLDPESRAHWPCVHGPITMALSPARTRSMIRTCQSAAISAAEMSNMVLPV